MKPAPIFALTPEEAPDIPVKEVEALNYHLGFCLGATDARIQNGPIDEWIAQLKAWLLAGYRMGRRDGELRSYVLARAYYRDDTFSPWKCNRCQQEYRGPAVYCSFECAEADA